MCSLSFPTGCQSFQAKGFSCPQSDFISFPLERNVHDALPSPPLNGQFTVFISGHCPFRQLPHPVPSPSRDPQGVLSVARRSVSPGRDRGLRGLSGRRGAHARQTASVDGPSILPSPRHSINIPFFGPQGRSERDPLIGRGIKRRLGCPLPPLPRPGGPLG